MISPAPTPMSSSSSLSVSQWQGLSIDCPDCPGWLQTHKGPSASASQCWDRRHVLPCLVKEHCKISNSISKSHSILSSLQDVSSQLWTLSQHTRQAHIFPFCPHHKGTSALQWHPGTQWVTHLRTLETKEGKLVAGQGHPAKF